MRKQRAKDVRLVWLTIVILMLAVSGCSSDTGVILEGIADSAVRVNEEFVLNLDVDDSVTVAVAGDLQAFYNPSTKSFKWTPTDADKGRTVTTKVTLTKGKTVEEHEFSVWVGLFNADFADPSVWQVIGPNMWSIEQGMLTKRPLGGQTTIYVDFGEELTDYTIEADLRWLEAESYGGRSGPLGRFNPDTDTYYYVRFHHDRIDYFRVEGGTQHSISDDQSPTENLEIGKWYHVKMVFSGNNVKFYIDDDLVLDYDDDPATVISSGRAFGFRGWSTPEYQIKNIRVY